MQAIPLAIEDFKRDYPKASMLLANSLDLSELDIFFYEDMLFAYPKAEYLFKLGNWSAFYNKYNEQWLKGMSD